MGLLKRKTIIFPTWRGWALVLGGAGILCWWVFHGIYDFLAENHPVPSSVLVVEGYGGDEMLRGAIGEFRRNHYEKLMVTGGPIERGAPLSEYKTLPELSVAALEKMGMDRNVMQAVPAEAVLKDRTYASAAALRVWLRSQNVSVQRINVYSEGLHSRRTHLLFQQAFGPSVTIGIVPYIPKEVDTSHWWRSSEEVRGVIGEGLALIYAKFFFRKPD